MKKKIIGIALLFSLFGAGVYALTVTQVVDNTIVYLKKLIFTDDGTNLGNQKIVIDGTNGSIAMSGNLNIQQGALKDNTVTTDDLVDGAITSSKIAPGAITQDKIASTVEIGVFKKNGTNAYYNNGNVGIGTSTPTQKLEVNGTIKSNDVVVPNQAYMYVCVKNGNIVNMYIGTETTPSSTNYDCLGGTTYKMQALKFNN